MPKPSHQPASLDAVAISLMINDGDTAQGNVRVQNFSSEERMKRALKTLGGGWLGMFVCVFIPGLHFILVPTLFLGTIYVAWTVYDQHSAILDGEGTCPACKKKFPILRSQWKWQWPFKVTCPNCYQTVTLSPRAQG
jgi:hypothetical protein